MSCCLPPPPPGKKNTVSISREFSFSIFLALRNLWAISHDGGGQGELSRVEPDASRPT